jgi:hypothetical protein
MNDPAPRPSRDPLSTTLQTWRHEPAPAPAFNHEVWARIRSVETRTARRYAALIPFHAALPLAASLAILLSVAAGTAGAFALNRTIRTDRMAVAYVRSIDPIQMTALNGAHAGHTHP